MDILKKVRPMSQSKHTLKAIPGTTLRRLRSTPSYFFLIWRWTWWLYALIIILGYHLDYMTPTVKNTGIFLLIVTFIQTLILTLYAPVFHIFLPRLPRPGARHLTKQQRKRQQVLAEDEEASILTPMARTQSSYWNVTIYIIDVLICGLVVYFAGPNGGAPYLGASSPFYRYGISTAFAAAFAYRYRGGIAAAIGYDLFILLAMFVPAPGTPPHYQLTVVDIAGSLIDTPIAAILAAYLATLLANYAQSKRHEQDNARTQRSLVRVGETLMKGANDRQQLLQQSVTQIRQGGHFQRLMISLISNQNNDEENNPLSPEVITCVAADVHSESLSNDAHLLTKQVMQSCQKLNTFESLKDETGYGIARLYMPFHKDGQVQLVLGADSIRQTSFGEKQEEFLTIAGAQLLVALDNIRLTEQTIELTATAERSRIAREIHDGIAQLVYMMSLNTETCATQAHRIAEASEEDAELITPLATRLDTLVTVSKQALWETRNYMFNLKPLMSGTTNLTEMLTNQLREFEAISGLQTQLEVEGVEEAPDGDQRHARKHAQVGAAIFRIVQEALTNAYKHADATQLQVRLHHSPQCVEVDICDDGHGMQSAYYSYGLSNSGDRQRLYSGHGMRGMRERAEELGGIFDVAPLDDGGVKVHVQIPVQ